MSIKDNHRIILIIGDGKEKTDAALGIALRASGHGMKSLFIQFIESDTGIWESGLIENLPEIEVLIIRKDLIPPKNNNNIEHYGQKAESVMKIVQNALTSGKYHIIILDKICNAISEKVLDEYQLLEFVEKAHKESTVVISGRNAPQRLIDIADTVTEIRSIK